MLKLIVVSGIPGTGKSFVAERISKALSLPIFSIDPIEAAMWRGGVPKGITGIAAYEVVATLSDEHLKLGHSVIVDAVSPIEAARSMWRRVAKKHGAHLIVVEVTCSDEKLHKQRIEKRMRHIKGMPEVSWERVLERKREFEPWQEPHLVLDSVENPKELQKKALVYLNFQT